jgi:hypothetical protein
MKDRNGSSSRHEEDPPHSSNPVGSMKTVRKIGR